MAKFKIVLSATVVADNYELTGCNPTLQPCTQLTFDVISDGAAFRYRPNSAAINPEAPDGIQQLIVKIAEMMPETLSDVLARQHTGELRAFDAKGTPLPLVDSLLQRSGKLDS